MRQVFMTGCIFLTLFSMAFAQIDYGSQVEPIFNSFCAGQCHGSNSGVTLTSYSAAMSSVGTQYGTLIVVPGDTGASPLWDKINPNPLHGSHMPPSGVMSEDNRNVIAQWILEGALETPSAVASDRLGATGFGLIGSYPNPFNPSTTIRFVLSTPSPIILIVYDLRGRPVHEHESFYGSGSHEVPLMLSHLASGMYVVRMRAVSGSSILTSRAMKIMMMK